jgi:cell division initiation protein
MELTPKVFRDVQFREKLRGGYHPEDVDGFLEQAAVAADELQQRLQRAETRADRAERSLEDASTNDDTLKRVLLMAQRTADQTVREAREEAERMLTEARAQGQAVVAEAEERGRRAYEAKAAEARASLEKTEDALRRALREADDLRAWVDANKLHLLEALREATAAVERAGLTGEPPLEVVVSSVPVSPLPGGSLNEGAPDMPEALPTAEPPKPEAPRLEAPRPEEQQRSGATVDVRASTLASQPDGAAREEHVERVSSWDQHFSEGPPSAHGDAGGDETQPATVAFDERALDNFFQEQDMGAERGLGRFRRRG